MLGDRTQVCWAMWDFGPARALGSWRYCGGLSYDALVEKFEIPSASVRAIHVDFENALPNEWVFKLDQLRDLIDEPFWQG